MKYDLNNAINEFVNGINRGPFKCLKGQDKKDSQKVVADNNGGFNDIYKCAVYQAWLDTCRTVKVEKNDKVEKYKRIREQIAGKLKAYFEREEKSDKASFDEGYKKILEQIDNKYERCLTVGQLQKLINMAFKYLYCCVDYRVKDEKFLYCHMPLDSFTLGWFKEKEKEEKKKNKEYEKTYGGEAWSSINSYEKYIGIQNGIRKVLGDNNVLKEEFIIWQQEKSKGDVKELKVILKRCGGSDCLKKLLSEDSEKKLIINWLNILKEQISE